MKFPDGWTPEEEKTFQTWASEHNISPDEDYALFDYRDMFRKQQETIQKTVKQEPTRDRIIKGVGNAIGVPPEIQKIIGNAMRDKYIPVVNLDGNSSVGIGKNSPIGLYYKKRF